MKSCVEMFDSIGYAGTGRHGLARCIAAFEAGDKDKAITEYRQIIGESPNFASVVSDINTEKFSTEMHKQYFNRVMGVMFGMSILMNGNPK
jgi:hypothetical protein